jgi:gamma-glutamylcyclotransferase (GGCT)/AIG2-like uncharacterized protein YtfP
VADDVSQTELPDQLLFSYGNLQHPDVQLDTFGRLVEAEDDVLPGFTMNFAKHLRATGSARDKVVGKALRVSEAELEAADEYEVSLYRRAAVVLASGRTAWVYVSV